MTTCFWVDSSSSFCFHPQFAFFLLTFFLCNQNFYFYFVLVHLQHWNQGLKTCFLLQHWYSLPHICYWISYDEMGWTQEWLNSLQCGFINSRAFVNLVIHMLCLLSFCKCFWAMCIALGGQFCFVLQVISFMVGSVLGL